MLRLTTITLATLLVAGAASAAAPAMGPTATARKFIDLANTGDDKGALAMCAQVTAVVDEFAPHVWTGAGACQNWFEAFGAWTKAGGIDGDKVILGPTTIAQIDGDTAYVVFPATETWTHAGAPMAETARLAFTLKKDGGAWTLSSLAWAGGRPHPAPAAKAAAPAEKK